MLAGLALVAASELIALAIDRPLPSRAGPLLQTIRMGLVVGAVRIGLTRVIHQEERRFWKEIGLAFALQLLAAAVLTVAGTGPLAVKVVIDGLFAFSYLALVIAVERPIRRRRGLHPADLGPSVEWSGGAVFVLGLLFYFSIISLLANRQAYESLLPSAYMVLVLDIYILVRLYYFGSHSEAPRWRMLYSLLMVAIFLVFANHLLTSLELSEAVAELPGTLVDFGWNIPFLALILAIRLRHHPFPSDESLFDSVNRRDRLPWPRERLVIFALAFPFIHLAFHTADLLDPTSKPVRESFALAWLMLFGALALVQQRMLEKRARTLWRERMQAEEALTKSHETLRLATERAQAEEAMRKSEEKFTKAFRSIPDSMLISTLADGRILEINESFRRHFGYEREAVVGRTGVELDLSRTAP